MIGKKIKVNDYKLTYGQETIILNVYGAFKNIKTGNKYVLYSYDNNKLFYGTFFKRNDQAIVMASKENPKEEVKKFINSLLKEEKNEELEIISLEEINSIQIIDEYTDDFNINIERLYEITIPKPIVQEVLDEPKKKTFSITILGIILLIVVIIAFFIVNPEIILGKNKNYICTKTYNHNSIPTSINEELNLTFNSKGSIINIDVTSDYIFNNRNYYKEFKEKGYFYQYMEEGDTYKFIDEKYTYRIFSKIDVAIDFFLPTEESELISYYEDSNYTCKVVEEDE